MRHFVRAGQRPEAVFPVDPADGPVTIRAYCNLHGLWETTAKAQEAQFEGERLGTGRVLRGTFCGQPARTAI